MMPLSRLPGITDSEVLRLSDLPYVLAHDDPWKPLKKVRYTPPYEGLKAREAGAGTPGCLPVRDGRSSG